jgi:beta-galactosidase
VNYAPGTLKAVSRKKGNTVLITEVKTAGIPARIELSADRRTIKADGSDLSFITVKILDKDGNLVPNADNKVNFKIDGEAFIAGVDNGDPINHDSFKAYWRKAYNGLALAIIQAKDKVGFVKLTATSNGLQAASIQIELNK